MHASPNPSSVNRNLLGRLHRFGLLFALTIGTLSACGSKYSARPRPVIDEEPEATIPLEEALRAAKSGNLPTTAGSTTAGSTKSPTTTAKMGSAVRDRSTANAPDGVGTSPSLPNASIPTSPGLESPEAERRILTAARLAKIQKALEAYREQNGNYPDRTLAQRLSWRVMILPWLGYKDLYLKFRKSEAWDSDLNRPLIAEMPDEYRAVQRDDEKTNFLLVTGMGTAYPTDAAIESGAFLDGWQNTLLVAEVHDNLAVPWTQPDDYHVARARIQRDLFELRRDGCFGIFGGSTGVRYIPANIDDESLLAIMTPAGKEGIEALGVTREPHGEVDESLIAELEQNPPSRKFEKRPPIAAAKPVPAPVVEDIDEVPVPTDGRVVIDSEPDPRCPIPSSAELEKATLDVQEIYADLWSKCRLKSLKNSRTPMPQVTNDASAEKTLRENRRTLAQRLLFDSEKYKNEAAGLYVVLRECIEIAGSVGDVKTSTSAADKLVAVFEVNSVPRRLQALELAVRHIQDDTSAITQSYDIALEIGDDAMQVDDFTTASSAYRVALSAARRNGSQNQIAESTTLVKRLEESRRAYRKVADSAHMLLKAPNDAAANSAIGWYFSLVKADFERGVPHLARGSDTRFKSIAERDQKSPKSAHDQAVLGDDWWELGESLPTELEKSNARRRARVWYAKAIPHLPDGLNKARAEKRISMEADESSADGSPRRPATRSVSKAR